MDDGDRTRDDRIHSPVLYQLSYVHHPRIGAIGWGAGGPLPAIPDGVRTVPADRTPRPAAREAG